MNKIFKLFLFFTLGFSYVCCDGYYAVVKLESEKYDSINKIMPLLGLNSIFVKTDTGYKIYDKPFYLANFRPHISLAYIENGDKDQIKKSVEAFLQQNPMPHCDDGIEIDLSKILLKRSSDERSNAKGRILYWVMLNLQINGNFEKNLKKWYTDLNSSLDQNDSIKVKKFEFEPHITIGKVYLDPSEKRLQINIDTNVYKTANFSPDIDNM